MSYKRIIPRDLFNESNLLKCLGHVYIGLETAGKHQASLTLISRDMGFKVDQNKADGALSATNVSFRIAGKPYLLYRPLNSREPWPLYAQLDCWDEPTEVFNNDGTLSNAFLGLIGSDKWQKEA